MLAGEKEVLHRISSILRNMYPDTIVGVFAFGSRVRGDHSADSDFDVLVIVKRKSAALVDKIIGVFVEEELTSGYFFDPVIKSADSFEQEKKSHSPFYENIARDAVPI